MSEEGEGTPAERAGLVLVYTGDGKGKTTAALGLALQMLGHGWKVLVLQFLKGPLASGELVAAKRLAPGLSIRTLGRGYVHLVDGKPKSEDIEHARQSWEQARLAVLGDRYDAVVLDEANVLTSLGLVEVRQVLALMEEARRRRITLILTGRGADAVVIEQADIVTEMKSVKHVLETGRSDIPAIER